MHWPSRLIGTSCLVFIAVAMLAARPRADMMQAASAVQSSSSSGGYVGSTECRRCHESQYDTWKRTLHVQMTKPIAEARVEGNFSAGTHLEAYGRAYTMESRDGRYFITVSKGGRPPEKFEVNYTLGARRFQGYLSKLPDGRIYVLPVFWHNESKRWLDWKEITPIPDDPDHDLRQIWNVTCVNCHATNLAKNFDVATKHYATTWTEMGIGCEACHGPGQPHIALMDEWRANPASKPAYSTSASNHDLSRILKIFSPRTAVSRQVFDTCGYCHGNKNNSFFGFRPGGRYEDFALPFLISEPIPDNDPQGDYWPDGRPSRFNRPQAIMLTGCFQSGQVVCTNCHRMHGSNALHSLKLQVEQPGGGHTRESDTLCTQCHAVGSGGSGGERLRPERGAEDRAGGAGEAGGAGGSGGSGRSGGAGEGTTGYGGTLKSPTTFADLTSHTHHAADSQGSRCINCHMSDVNWRLITRRLDHTFQPPVPEMTIRYGAPNACTTCHEEKSPEWAIGVMDQWYGNGERRRAVVAMGDVLYRAGTGDISVLPDIARLAVDRTKGAVIRASAAEFAGQLIAAMPHKAESGAAPALPKVDPVVANALMGAAADPEPIVRITAVRALGVLKESRTVTVLAARLTDEARVVRASAAEALMNLGIAHLDGDAGQALAHAQDDWAESLRTFNDLAEDHVQLGWLEASRGQPDAAQKSLKNAVVLNPRDARPHVYLGIVAARAGKYDQALDEFKIAKTLDPSFQNLDRLIEEARKRASNRH